MKVEIINEKRNLLASNRECLDSRMNIQEELRVLGHQPVVFSYDSEKGYLYREILENWHLEDMGRCGPFSASVFYNLGRIHGIRDERARRKAGVVK